MTTPADAGLCASCVYARTVTSARGSVFVMCELSLTDARYRKYPPLPVLRCEGYGKHDDGAGDDASRETRPGGQTGATR